MNGEWRIDFFGGSHCEAEAGREGKEAASGRGMEGPETSETTRVSRKKQLQRLEPAEDERKLQTKRFVKLRV